MKTSTGIYTNAVYTMLSQVIKIIKEQKPSHIAFVFDKSRDTLIRKQWYPQYKANRRQSPQALQTQFQVAETALSKMGFPVFYHDGYEADDFAGSIAKKFENEIPVYLVTKDADYLQLVNDNTRVWMVQKDQQTAQELIEKYCFEDKNIPNKAFEYNPFTVFSEYGLFPEQIVDMKAIQGDSSDNIPGVNGVASAAIPLLQKYKTVEGIYEVLDGKSEEELNQLKEEWKNELGIKRSPIKYLTAPLDEKTNLSAKETALLSKKLATIMTNLPLNFSLDRLQTSMNRDGYNAVLNWLEIKSL
jgi:DNA polymerase-1